MEEQLITFETAVLARSKGFNEPTKQFYSITVTTEAQILACEDLVANTELIHDSEIKDYSAPTQSFLQKWLRESRNVIVFVQPSFRGWNNNLSLTINNQALVFQSYEKALEAGLIEALNKLKTNE